MLWGGKVQHRRPRALLTCYDCQTAEPVIWYGPDAVFPCRVCGGRRFIVRFHGSDTVLYLTRHEPSHTEGR